VKQENPYPGLFKTSANLKTGKATYYYAWKNGPRLHEPYGSPEFAAAFLKTQASRAPVSPPSNSVSDISSLIRSYKKSRGKKGRRKRFLSLGEKTQNDYLRYLGVIESEFGTMPLPAVEERGSRQVFMEWRDEIAEDHPRKADYAIAVMSAVFSFGVDSEILERNPVLDAGRVYEGSRVEIVWSVEQLEFFVANAPARIARAVILGCVSGQRQGDCLAATWERVSDKFLDVRQSKGDEHVKVPVWGPLATLFAATPENKRRGPILTTLEGKRWTSDGFRTEFGKAREAVVEKAKALRAAAGDEHAVRFADQMLQIADRRFSDLRGFAATMLRNAGCTIEEISAITGHKRADVSRILDRHYLKNDGALADSAAAKLQNALQKKLRALEERSTSL
jgi:integrase